MVEERSSSSSAVDLTPIIGIVTWIISISYFIVRNYHHGPWLVPMGLNERIWVFIHAISSMLFSSGVVLSTILEWRVLSTKNPEVIYDWFTNAVPTLNGLIVLPSLTFAMISGFAQAALKYGAMANAPQHIRFSVHIILAFGMWWVITDVPTQESAKVALNQWYNKEMVMVKETREEEESYSPTTIPTSATTSIPNVLYLRRWSNVVSCLFVASLYGIMTLKPRFKSWKVS